MTPAFSRLYEQLNAAGIPILSVDGLDGAATITYAADATPAHRTQGASILASFDWSEAASTAWAVQKEKALAAATLDAPVDADRLIRALALVVMDEVNILRARFTGPTLSPRTVAQVIAAVKAKL